VGCLGGTGSNDVTGPTGPDDVTGQDEGKWTIQISLEQSDD
jgi:hypothetical protein